MFLKTLFVKQSRGPANAGLFSCCPFRSLTLTTSTKETLAYPPAQLVPDTIVFFKQVDWREVGQRCKAGLNNLGLVIAVLGEKVHDLGVFLASI